MRNTAVAIFALFAPNILTGCLQENPRFDLETAGSSSSVGDDPPGPTSDGLTDPGGSSSSGEPTTGAGPSSTGEPGSSSTGDGSSGDTTEGLEFPTCPYEPPGVEVGITLSDGGATQDETLRPCGDTETWGPMLSEGYDGLGHHFQRCADDLCGSCDPMDRLDLALIAPDPFGGPAAALLPGACARLQVTWNRPIPGDPSSCRASTVALVDLVDGAPRVVPAVLYRHTHALPASDLVEGFELKAAAAKPGLIECACEGDCCREDPGSRQLDFTMVISGDASNIPTLESQQAVQGLDVGGIEGRPETGELALVRSFFPSACLEAPQYEWLFARI
nr:hypothetical protein [Nannocystis sp.]